MSEQMTENEQHLREAAELAGMALEEVVQPSRQYLEADGLRLHYLNWGTAGKPTVLFLHGGGLTAHTWDLVCLALRRGYHCLAFDLRGHGDSEWSAEADYRIEAHRADLEAAVGQLDLRRFLLVGMSLGGATALAYAGQHAERLAGLVLVDTGPETREAGGRRIAQFASNATELDSIDQFVERAMAFNPRRKPELLRRSLLNNLRQTPAGKWTWKYDPRRFSGMTAEAREHRRALLRAAVPRVSCPTLVVRGSESDVFHDDDARSLAATLPQATWIRIEGAGHTVQGDQPAALTQALRQFFAEAWTD